MIDGKTMFHAPAWVKIASLSLLAVAFAFSVWLTVVYVGTDKENWVLVALSIAQIALSGLVFVLIYLFSEREYSVVRLEKLARRFLVEDVLAALQKMDFPGIGKPEVELAPSASGIFGQAYRLNFGDTKAAVWVGVNVHKVWVIFFIDKHFDPERFPKGCCSESLSSIFEGTLGGAKATGYSVSVEDVVAATEQGESRELLSVWSTNMDTNPHMMSDAHRRLFWANDIAMMTYSFLYTACRNDVPVCHDPEPRPI